MVHRFCGLHATFLRFTTAHGEGVPSFSAKEQRYKGPQIGARIGLMYLQSLYEAARDIPSRTTIRITTTSLTRIILTQKMLDTIGGPVLYKTPCA